MSNHPFTIKIYFLTFFCDWKGSILHENATKWYENMLMIINVEEIILNKWWTKEMLVENNYE
jgi:hypothetical protein